MKSKYQVISYLEHDGKPYAVGSSVDLTTDEAMPLLGHTVKPADGAHAGPTEMDLLVGAVELGHKLEQAEKAKAELQQQLDEARKANTELQKQLDEHKAAHNAKGNTAKK